MKRKIYVRKHRRKGKLVKAHTRKIKKNYGMALFYHVTSKDNLDSIKKEGLKPNFAPGGAGVFMRQKGSDHLFKDQAEIEIDLPIDDINLVPAGEQDVNIRFPLIAKQIKEKHYNNPPDNYYITDGTKRKGNWLYGDVIKPNKFKKINLGSSWKLDYTEGWPGSRTKIKMVDPKKLQLVEPEWEKDRYKIEDIKESGEIREPVKVWNKFTSEQKYQLRDGHHRTIAARERGDKLIAAEVWDQPERRREYRKRKGFKT